MKRKIALILTIVLTLNLFLMTSCNKPKDIDVEKFGSFIGMSEDEIKKELKEYNVKTLEYEEGDLPMLILNEKQSWYNYSDFDTILYFNNPEKTECLGFGYLKCFVDEPSKDIVDETFAIIDKANEKYGESTNYKYYYTSTDPQEAEKPISLFNDFLEYFEEDEKLNRREEWDFEEPDYYGMDVELRKFENTPEDYKIAKYVKGDGVVETGPCTQLRILYGIRMPYRSDPDNK